LLFELEAQVTWAVKVTEEYAAWFGAMITDDLASATQVAQAVAALREEGPALGRPHQVSTFAAWRRQG